MRIGDRELTESSPAYVIAEVGINHNGEVPRAHRMIDLAAECGADCVKFQTFHAAQFCGDPQEPFTYKSQGQSVTESMLEMFRRVELPDDVWPKLAEHSRERGLDFMTTPQDWSDFELVRPIGLPAIKVGSDDLVHSWLIDRYRDTGLPIILSSGMADMAEVAHALEVAGWPQNADVALLVCTSMYPTPPDAANLGRIATLRDEFPGLTLGFSDHTRGSAAAGVARSMGAAVFEKHFTESHDLPGPDHWFSADPEELREWVSTIRQVEVLLGSGDVVPAQGEIPMRRLARRSITAIRDIAVGEVLSEYNIGMRRPAGGLPSDDFSEVIGRVAHAPIPAWQHVSLDQLEPKP